MRKIFFTMTLGIHRNRIQYCHHKKVSELLAEIVKKNRLLYLPVMMKQITIVLIYSIIFMGSCKKEETPDYRNLLTGNSWEQQSGFNSDSTFYYGTKWIYRLKFNTDNTCEMVWRISGFSFFYDTLVFDTIRTRYTLESNLITFDGPVDTVYASGDTTKLFKFIHDWKIKTLNNESLETEAIDNYTPSLSPCYVVGAGNFYLKPLEE